MDYLSQHPVIGALIFVIIVIGPIALAVHKKKKKDRNKHINKSSN